MHLNRIVNTFMPQTPAKQSSRENKVTLQFAGGDVPTAKRLLDLNNIQTLSLQILSPTAKEIAAVKVDAKQALDDYTNRLREDYKTNKEDFRDGLKLLSDSLDKGEQIAIACSCRGSARMCHADVVKMAIEKVNAHTKNGQISEMNRNDRAESRTSGQVNSTKQQQIINPRTRRAINEIFSFSENDRMLETINDSGGRNRSEQASHLAKSSQFVRDIYERGANIVDGNLIVPQERLTVSPPLSITTQDYAVEKLGKILHDEERAKELAPVVVAFGNKISGLTADGETKLKVFSWMYDSLEGKSESLERDENNFSGEKPKFDETLEKISVLAEEMHSLEPLDKIEVVPLAGLEQSCKGESVFDKQGENLNLEEIYEEAISIEESEKEQLVYEQNAIEQAEPSGKINTEGYERIELGAGIPRIPEDYTRTEINKLITDTLPEIDRQLENGVTPKEILTPYNQAVWQSAREDALSRLESIYQKQKINGNESQQQGAKAVDLNHNLHQQMSKIDLRRQNIIELRNPGEYLSAEKEAVNTFYRQQRLEVGRLLTRIDEIREKQPTSSDKVEQIDLKKELNQIREAKPNFAFKLENSAEIVVGQPSEQLVQARNFISSYINYQLKQPETRLRFKNERYRAFAARLESATTRDEVMKSASRIRAENAALGMRWKDLEMSEKEKLPPPLTNKEMQFLFTETSPAHYTNEMTAARLSYAHAGASRRALAQSLLKGEIKPSPEAKSLIDSLEKRVERSDLKNATGATRHFYLSLKTPNENLKIKNSFCHKEIYQKLPPPEKDFVFQRAMRQLGNLEYRSVFRQQQQINAKLQTGEFQPEKTSSWTEKSFRIFSTFSQARILGEKIELGALNTKEISRNDAAAVALLLNNQSIEKNMSLSRELIGSRNPEHQKIGEVLGVFSRAENQRNGKTAKVLITLPEKSFVGAETYAELLEKFYPESERDQFKLSRFGSHRVAEAKIKGETEVLKSWSEEIKTNDYKPEATELISFAERELTENISRLGSILRESGVAQRENNAAVSKYIREASTEIQKQKQALPALKEQKRIVLNALQPDSAGFAANNANDRFFQTVQKKITFDDFQKFAAGEKLLTDNAARISQIFSQIESVRIVLDENKIKDYEPKVEEKAENARQTNQKPEIEPLSLRLYEAEIERAEKRLLTKSLSEKLALNKELLKSEKPLNLETAFSPMEREQIRRDACQIAKERLEPKELDADHRKISVAASRQALSTFKQLEQAHNLYQFSNDAPKISEAFFKLDREAASLFKIREEYNRGEKIALLRDGIKSDLIDLLKKSGGAKSGDLIEQTSKILAVNLTKTGLEQIAFNTKKIAAISLEIGEKTEQRLGSARKINLEYASAKESRNQQLPNFTKTIWENAAPKNQPEKDAPVFSR